MRWLINTIITITVCFSIFFTTFTPVKAFVSGGQTLSFLIPVVLIFMFDKLFLRKEIISTLVVVILIVFLHFLGVGYFENYLPECLYLLFTVFSLEHYLVTREKSYAKWVLLTEYGILFILIIISIPQFILQPNLTRILNQAAEDPTIEFDYYWCISYRTVHELPILSVSLFALFFTSNKRLWKILAIVGLALMLVVMVYASSATSLLLMLVIYVFFLFYNKRKTIIQNLTKGALLLLLFTPFLSTTFTIGVIDNVVMPVFEGSSTSQRIEEIRYYIKTGETEGDMDTRDMHYQTTINSIISNPILPEFDNRKIGQHSFLLDHLAAMGLLLFVPYFIFFYDRYKRAKQYLHVGKPFQIVASSAFVLLAVFKNYFVFTSAMFIVPLFLIQTENNLTSK